MPARNAKPQTLAPPAPKLKNPTSNTLPRQDPNALARRAQAYCASVILSFLGSFSEFPSKQEINSYAALTLGTPEHPKTLQGFSSWGASSAQIKARRSGKEVGFISTLQPRGDR